MIRQPSVAGQFYESSRSGLAEQVGCSIPTGVSTENVIGAVSPHAGLMYSGAVAGAVYSKITFPSTFVIIGPNHTGLGRPVSIMSSGRWQIPTGELEIDETFANKLKGQLNVAEEDSLAHKMEHSLEVQLPFILYFSSTVKIVPVVMMIDSLEVCESAGYALAEVIKNTDYPVTIIASSDMSHYVSDSIAREKDRKAIDRIIDIDPEGLYHTIKKEGISMCGFIPVTTMLYAARKLGAKESNLVKYMTSGEVSGDYDQVVGYAGLIVKTPLSSAS